MQWHHCSWVIVVAMILSQEATAGIIFNKKPKPSPQRAQELIGILKSDSSESKRASAADELGHYDGKAFPEIVPVLIEALRDSSTSVRLQAVESLGKVRPVSQEAGMALEQAMANDSSMRVRVQARTTLWQYHMAGYHTPKNEGPALKPQPTTTSHPAIAPQPFPTQEPPLAEPHNGSAPIPLTPPSPSRYVPVPTSPLPQLSRPVPAPTSRPPLVPTQPPPLETPPATPPADQGPDLNAPK